MRTGLIAIMILLIVLAAVVVLLYCCLLLGSNTSDKEKEFWERFKGLDKKGW